MNQRRIPIRHRRRSQRRQGAILVIALGIIMILSGLILVFARNMRTEALASANQLSYIQADAVEQGAEQWVLAQTEEYGSDAVTLTELPTEGIQVGSGYFWIIRPNATSNQQYDFGLVDESGKLNLNSATVDELTMLPGMTSDVAQAIFDWRSPTGGGESSYYGSLAEPYESKDASYDTVEELNLVEGVTPQLLFGEDLLRNGMIDPSEETSGVGGAAAMLNTGEDTSRGIINDVTVYSVQSVRGRTMHGLINVYTAPEAVLMCLPGLTQSDADQIINARTSQASARTPSWVANVIGQNKYTTIAASLTGVSYQYSADIVAVSGDGRSYKRVRIVVDDRQTPAKIVYRQDLTGLGWPLPNEIRTAMRAGQPPPADYVSTTAVNGLNGLNP
jgi:type II secretory pathway component PulK